MAVYESGYVDMPPPFELVLAQICESWHVLPSQLMEEDSQQVMTFWKLNRLYEQAVRKRPEWMNQD